MNASERYNDIQDRIASLEAELEKARAAAERNRSDIASLRRSDWWRDRAQLIASLENLLMALV